MAMGGAPARTPQQAALDEYNAVVNNRSATPAQKAAAKAKLDAFMAGNPMTDPRHANDEANANAAPAEGGLFPDFGNPFDGGGFWGDLGNYAFDALTGGAGARATNALVEGDIEGHLGQVANMGGTPLGATVMGGNPEGAPPVPWHDENGDWTGPRSIGNIRNGILGAYGIPGQNAPRDVGGVPGGPGGGAVGAGGYIPHELDRGAFDNGAADFYEPGDQSAFLYEEALNRSREGYTPSHIRDVAPIVAPSIRDVDLGPAGVQTAAGMAPVERYTAATVGGAHLDPAAQARAATVQRTQFDRGLAMQQRGNQLADVDRLRSLADGTGPSAAGDEFALALDAIANEQMGAAAGARGADKVALTNQAISGIGRQAMLAARERAALKAREMQTGMLALPGAAAGIRAQDIGVASKIADLDQQAAMLDAQLQTAVAEGNRDAINQINTARAQLQQQRAIAQAQLDTQASADGAAAWNEAGLDYVNRQDVVGAGNLDREQERTIEGNRMRLDRDIAVGDQSITAQQITNDQGVNRDVSVNDAGQAAWSGNQDANRGMLDIAGGATANLTDAVRGRSAALQGQNTLALDQQQGRERLSSEGYRYGQDRADAERNRQDKLDAADRDMWLGAGAAGLEAWRNRNKSSSTSGYKPPADDDDIFRS